MILYAPTWRDDSWQASGYTFDLKADFRKWKEKLGPDTVVLFKPHYLIVNRFRDDPELKDFLISVPADSDIRELYVVSDALVTDYSSVFFDYGILRRPVYFYMYDLESYAGDLRDFTWTSKLNFPERFTGRKSLCWKIWRRGNSTIPGIPCSQNGIITGKMAMQPPECWTGWPAD